MTRLPLPPTLLALCLLTLGSGCATLPGGASLSKVLPWSGPGTSKPYPKPAKMAFTWTPDVLMQPGRTPTRGFGGRVFFYDEKSRPVPVEGELVVHAFDESVAGTSPDFKRYRFTPEQFTQHFSQTEMGASYSFWIPWDAAGGAQRRITLVPSFEASSGHVLQGSPAVVLLPGPREKTLSTDLSRSNFAPPRPQISGATGLTTTTIPVPSSFHHRMVRSGGDEVGPAQGGTTVAHAGAMHAAGMSAAAVAPQAPAAPSSAHVSGGGLPSWRREGDSPAAPVSPTGWPPPHNATSPGMFPSEGAPAVSQPGSSTVVPASAQGSGGVIPGGGGSPLPFPGGLTGSVGGFNPTPQGAAPWLQDAATPPAQIQEWKPAEGSGELY